MRTDAASANASTLLSNVEWNVLRGFERRESR